MAAGKRVAKNTFYVLFSNFLNKVISVAFIVYSARLLGAKAYGMFVLVNTMLLISTTLTNFGIRAMIIRRISKDRASAEPLLSNILAIRFLLSIAAYALLGVFVNLYGYSQELKDLVYIAGGFILFDNLTASFGSVYIAYERMRIWGALLVASSFAVSAVSIGLLAAGYWLRAVFAAKVAVGGLTALISGYIVWKRFFRFRPRIDPALARDIMSQSVPFFAALVLSTLLTKVDIMMLSMVDGPIERNLAIGYYAPAHNILLALMIMPRSINMAMLPVVSRKIYSDDEFVRMSVEKATRFMMIAMSFPIILASTLFPDELVSLFFGPKFAQSASALMILGWSYAFYALNIPSQAVLGSSRELKDFLPLLFWALVLNVALNLFLIPKYSYNGAAVATCIIMVLSFVGRFYFLRKILAVRISEIKGYAKLAALLGTTLLCTILIKERVGWYLLAAITVALYLLLLFAFRVLDRDEAAMLRAWVRGRAGGGS